MLGSLNYWLPRKFCTTLNHILHFICKYILHFKGCSLIIIVNIALANLKKRRTQIENETKTETETQIAKI